MTFSEQVIRWATANADRLSRLGEVTVQTSDGGGSKPSAHVAIEDRGRFAEIIVWDSGEVEFAHGAHGHATDEHYDLTSPKELDDLLEQLVLRAQAWSNDA